MTERWQESSRFSDAGSYYLQDLEIAAPEVGAAVAQLFVGDDGDEWATGQVTHVHNGVYTVEYGDGHTVQFENDLQALKQAVFDGLPQIGTRIRKGGFEPDPLELYPGTVHAVGRPRTGPAAGTLELKVKYDDGDEESFLASSATEMMLLSQAVRDYIHNLFTCCDEGAVAVRLRSLSLSLSLALTRVAAGADGDGLLSLAEMEQACAVLAPHRPWCAGDWAGMCSDYGMSPTGFDLAGFSAVVEYMQRTPPAKPKRRRGGGGVPIGVCIDKRARQRRRQPQ